MEASRIQIDRPVYTQSSLDQEFLLQEPPDLTPGQRIKKTIKGSCPDRVGPWLLEFFPFIIHFKKYRENWKRYLAGDAIAGVSAGIMHIPMGMGFALLAGLPPVYGLYASFWCVFVYFFFGQSPHMSFGTMAITSIMLYEATHDRGDSPSIITSDDELTTTLGTTVSTSLSTGGTPAPAESDDDVAMYVSRTLTVTMLSGIIMIVMGILKLDKIVAFLPISCIGGFATATAFHITTSQCKYMFGITYPNHKGMFKLVKLWREIALELPNTNFCDLIISLGCLTVLFIIKEILNVKYRDKLPTPIPGEIIVVIVLTIVSHFGKLSERYGIQTLNLKDSGFLPPEIPDFAESGTFLLDAFVISIISFVIAYSMVAMFSRKHKYDVDTCQEMMAYGMCHVITSIFGGFAGTAAPPRCTVLDTTGAKTQIVHLWTSLVLMLTILFIGPLFAPLPNSCLAAVIICALIPLFKQFSQLVALWRVNKYDFFIWLITWASAVFLDIDMGLAVGIAFSVTTVVVQACRSTGYLMGVAHHRDLVQKTDRHRKSREIPGIKIFRFQSSLHFASQSRFKDELFRLTRDPRKTASAAKQREELGQIQPRSSSATPGMELSFIMLDYAGMSHVLEVSFIILDCSCMSYMDMMGLHLLKQLKEDYNQVGIDLVLASCSESVLYSLKAAGVANLDTESGADPDASDTLLEVFPTVHDAIRFGTYTLMYKDKEKTRGRKISTAPPGRRVSVTGLDGRKISVTEYGRKVSVPGQNGRKVSVTGQNGRKYSVAGQNGRKVSAPAQIGRQFSVAEENKRERKYSIAGLERKVSVTSQNGHIPSTDGQNGHIPSTDGQNGHVTPANGHAPTETFRFLKDNPAFEEDAEC